MQIKKITCERLDLKLSQPYTIAYETISEAANFILKIETSDGLTGWGCAAPDVPVTGESPADVERNFEEIIQPFLKGKDPFTYAKILEDLKIKMPKQSSSLTMVDNALFDLLARKAGLPLYKLLGGYRSSIPTSITIGILSIEETIRQAKEFVAQGFSILKIKGGISLEEDVEKMIRLRENLGKKITFRFDGNQGFTPDDAIDFVKKTEAVGIEIFEQPTLQHREAFLGLVTEKTEVPIMADESIKTLADTFRLAQNNRIDMVNIKIQKVGGILPASHINSVAKAAKLEAMVGCIDECALGISAGLHFALSRPNVEFADLDGHLDFIGDPFSNLFSLEKGVLIPSEAAGLGKVR